MTGLLQRSVKTKVAADLSACIGCNECLAACPVAPGDLRIATLNVATAGDGEVPDVVRTFASECIQCGLCVPACPAGLERDAMVLWLKHRLPKPPQYRERLKSLGARHAMTTQMGITVHNLKHRARLRQLAQHVDKRSLRVADTLFFFGCNIFTETGLASRVLALADYLKCDYEVLGGLRSCCGWPHYLAGEFDRAEGMMDDLFERIRRVAPKEVVTIGAECYTALARMVAVNGDLFTPVTCATWIRRNLHRFPIKRRQETLTFHDACHTSRKMGEGEEGRRILRQVGALVEMEAYGDNAPCCGHYQFDVNPPQLEGMRRQRLRMARDTGAGRMVVECVRCLEAYRPYAQEEGVEVVDLVDLVYESIDDALRPAPQPVHFARPVAPADNGAVPAEGT